MAIQLEANYSKKLGLPGYSSHQYSVTIRLEVSDIKQVEAESARLYALLQGCVDRDIQQTGFLPINGLPNGNGSSNGSHQNGSNRHSNGHANDHHGTNGNGRHNGESEAWSSSDKQRALILKIVEDHHLDKQDIESLAQERFGKGVRQLNKMEASGLIEELLETHGGNTGNHGNSRSNGNRFQNSQKAREELVTSIKQEHAVESGSAKGVQGAAGIGEIVSEDSAAGSSGDGGRSVFGRRNLGD